MTAIGKGDWVECVDDKPRSRATARDAGAARVVTGHLYRVDQVHDTEYFADGRSRPGSIGFVLVEPETRWIAFNGQQGSWADDRFRPIYRRDESLTQRLMEPVSDRIETGVSRKSRQDQPAHDEPVSSLREVA